MAGVWTIRSIAGAELNVAWGIAVIGAAMRWGTLSLSDVAVATDVAGPTVTSGPIAVRVGMLLALLSAIAGEWRAARWETRNWGERLAAATALTVLVPLFLLGGPTSPVSLLTLVWVAPVVVVTAATLLLRGYVASLPAWVASVAASIGVVISSVVP